jgi:phosphatidylserine/phosphatidylglycerophosphate/cardiolipin synthase-like enzyme
MARKREKHGDLTVHAVAGTYVVMLGINFDKDKCPGLRGFAIQRRRNDGAFKFLEASKIFAYAAHDVQPGDRVSTEKHPIQDFLWSDFATEPGVRYTYRIIPMTGDPQNLQQGDPVSVTIRTESPEAGDHDVYFNRGAAASQQFAREFHNQRPDVVGQPAWDWLSRGLVESIRDFIRQANGNTWGLRVAAYEFTYKPILDLLRTAHHDGADVKILYHAREVDSEEHDKNHNVKLDKHGKPILTQAGVNRAAVLGARIKGLCKERMAPTKSDISHNKFIVLLKEGKPVAVLTGSTNFTEGGIFGHSNVVHIVQDPKVAQAYLDYWNALVKDPHREALGPDLEHLCSIPPELPAKGTAMLYSPRTNTAALDYYARIAASARQGLFMTFAFGMNDIFQTVYKGATAPLRYALMEKMVLPRQDKVAEEAERQKIIALRRMTENVFAIGAFLPMNMFDHWLKEKLTGLNPNVKYLHTKYLVVDPLSEDPIVVSGSANFSAASCNRNDENMLIVRGNKRVADIYLGEFMRLHRHYAFREWASTHPEEADDPQHELLDEHDRWWRRFFEHTKDAHRREFFA